MTDVFIAFFQDIMPDVAALAFLVTLVTLGMSLIIKAATGNWRWH